MRAENDATGNTDDLTAQGGFEQPSAAGSQDSDAPEASDAPVEREAVPCVPHDVWPDHDCSEPATVRYVWEGSNFAVCADHFERIRNVAEVLSMDLQPETF